jgi:PAS domain S-box-containing protein
MIHRRARKYKLAKTVADLRMRLARCEATLHAIQGGEVDALVVSARAGDRIYTLEGANQVYRVLIETMSEGAAALDLSGSILYGNHQLAEMLGQRMSQLIGKPFQTFLGQSDREIFEKQLASNRPQAQSVDVGLMAVDGSVRPVHLSMALLDFGGIEGICLVATDMSYRVSYERELAERAQELSRSNSELERFAYVASHDLQEPLRVVGSFTQLLAKRYRGQLDSDADEFIGYVVDGVNRMQSMITDLLEYSRVGRQTRPFGPAELDEALSRALANLRKAIAESGASIEHQPLPRVWGDTAQLLRLFQNLIGNAIKFRSSENPRIQITAESLGCRWIISVRDNGIGIDPGHFERVFVLFQRLHDRSRYPGTGIGLAVCKKIVELHGGTIWLEPQSHAGACFRFSMPIRGDLTCESSGEQGANDHPPGR